jgi:hypothetical protein
MCAFQYDFFQEAPDEIEILKAQYLDVFNRSENVRKGCFKRINDMGKELIKMREDQDQMDRRLCALERSLNGKNIDFSLSVEACIGMKSR